MAARTTRRARGTDALIQLDGIHHISATTADAAGSVDFYAGLLGLRLAKKTVIQDEPTVYHLLFGDEAGSPGTALTFFEYPERCPWCGGRWNGASDRLARGDP